MKKILFVLPSLVLGGLERMQVTIANALARDGYEVTVMTLQPGDDLKGQLNSRVHFVYKPARPFRLIRRIPYIRHRFYDDGMWETRASARTLYQYYVGSEKYDVEIGFFRGLPIKIISGSTNAGSVKLAWVHSDFKVCGGYQNNFKSFGDVRSAYASFQQIVCVSRQAKESFQEVVGLTDKVSVIYNMLPVEEIERLMNEQPGSLLPKHDFNIVLVGRLLDSAKGQMRLVSIVEKLNREGRDIALTLVGSGPDEDKLRKHIEGLDADGYIYLAGSRQNPYPYIMQADLLVCASYFEGYNLTVAEALICGTPVLSTDCAGPCEILDNGRYGMLVENSEEGLYHGLKQLMEQPALLDKYRAMALLRGDFFSEKKILKQITDLFEKERD